MKPYNPYPETGDCSYLNENPDEPCWGDVSFYYDGYYDDVKEEWDDFMIPHCEGHQIDCMEVKYVKEEK